MLIHQIPPKPNYLRVKVGRRLARIGAVALKNTVYVLPRSDSAQEDFQWVLREVVAAGGEATLLEAHLVDGLADPEVEALFRNARDADYAGIASEARDIDKRLQGSTLDDDLRRQVDPELQRLERRLEEITALDFFGASGRETAHGLLASLRACLTPPTLPPAAPEPDKRAAYHGRTWVTRTGIHIDRMACAWLIRRFIDPGAHLKFVPAKGYVPEPGELRFEMFEAEFTHEGDRCSFEVLVDRFGLAEPALGALAEIVHDIDLKDSKFGRTETMGIASLVAGIAMAHRDDDKRLERASAVFEDLYEYFRRKGHVKGPPSEALGAGRKGEHVT